MTYDVYLIKNGKGIATPLTIHGMSYGARALDFANKYIFGDKELSPKEVKKSFKEFHKEFVKYCQEITETEANFGSDAKGLYFNKKGKLPHNPEEYAITIRWLQVYAVATALECGLSFQ